MQEFKLELANGATLTGIHNLAPRTPSSPHYLPLVVALHGGTYNAHYFDVDEKHTARTQSDALGIPFVSIDRPCYRGSTSFYPLPEDKHYHEVFGDWLHRYILPGLWKAFGEPTGCTSIVLLPHSLGVPGVIIAAAAHADDDAAAAAAYPLSGIILSGFGTVMFNPNYKPHGMGGASGDIGGASPPPYIRYEPPAIKDALMLPAGTADPAVHAHAARLNEPMPFEEIYHLRIYPGEVEERAAAGKPPRNVWLPAWEERYGAKVCVPVMLAVAERDALWQGSEAHLRDWMSKFPGSRRVDGALLLGAPHCIELSHWSAGWYARCFGFAAECAATFGTVKGADS